MKQQQHSDTIFGLIVMLADSVTNNEDIQHIKSTSQAGINRYPKWSKVLRYQLILKMLGKHSANKILCLFQAMFYYQIRSLSFLNTSHFKYHPFGEAEISTHRRMQPFANQKRSDAFTAVQTVAVLVYEVWPTQMLSLAIYSGILRATLFDVL